MSILLSIWTFFTNLVALVIFIGMLSVTSTSFETVVVSGLALIYTTIISFGVAAVRMQLAGIYVATNQFIFLAKLHKDPEKEAEINELEEDTKEKWDEYQRKNYIYYINMFFTFVIWVLAVGSIVSSL